MKSYISLFSSAGIATASINKNKYMCLATNELLKKRLNIQKYNNICKHDNSYILGDIQNDKIKEKLIKTTQELLEKENFEELDVLIATPPCQGISLANHKKNNELKRNSLVVESIDLTLKLKPKFFIFENVRGFPKAICTNFDNRNIPIREAIEENLGGKYNILFKIVNLKYYGSNSSRTRSIVIGVRKDLENISPYELFPKRQDPKPLKEIIGDLPKLNKMGEISKKDFLHSFREYRKDMRNWIKNLDPGQSAFDQTEIELKPHQIINGKIVINKNKNGDKYKRQEWDKVAPCIHTRNDILSSQNTIHPTDDRVFSIRELMRLMNIPKDFKWTDKSIESINNGSQKEKEEFYKNNDINIRKCIGEAVPSIIFKKITDKILEVSSKEFLSNRKIKKIIRENNLEKHSKLLLFIQNNFNKISLESLFKIAELANNSRFKNSAYYTRRDVCFNLIKDLPSFNNSKEIKILEPSVGVGNFLPDILKKYEHLKKITIDLCDIDSKSLEICKTFIKYLDIPPNFKINFINKDFILNNFTTKYDIVIGNPPFKRFYKKNNKYNIYKEKSLNKKSNNIFTLFIEKALDISRYFALITPKGLLNLKKYEKNREILSQKRVLKISDYNEFAFSVKIETIGIVVYSNSRKVYDDHKIKIESYLNNSVTYKNQKYIFNKKFPYWIIYRNDFFDNIHKKLKLDIFNVFRDRSIKKSMRKSKGKYRILRSRNIKNTKIINKKGYDAYIDDIQDLKISTYLNREDVILVPNMTYNPRATFLPKDTITDGSVAILEKKDDFEKLKIDKKDLEYFASKEFRKFYRIARNYRTRSLNIDTNSVYFFGIQ